MSRVVRSTSIGLRCCGDDRGTCISEAFAHVQLPEGAAFEPVLRDAVNPNSDVKPETARRAQDGRHIAGTSIAPIGAPLRLQGRRT